MIFPEGYDEGPCRVCGKHAFGMAYDVAGICDECAKEWGWNVEWEQKPMPPEFSKTVDKHFWELI